MFNSRYPRNPMDIVALLRNPNPNAPFLKDFFAAIAAGNVMIAIRRMMDRFQQQSHARSEKEKEQFIRDANAASILTMQNVVEATRNLGKPLNQETTAKSKDKLASDEAKKLVEILPQEIAVLKEVQNKVQEEIAITEKELVTANVLWDAKQQEIAEDFIQQLQTQPDTTFVDMNGEPMVLDEHLDELKAAMIRPSPSKLFAVNKALAEHLFTEVSAPENAKVEDKDEWQLSENANFICNHNVCIRTVDAARIVYEAQHKKPETANTPDLDSGVEEFNITDFVKLIFNKTNKAGFDLIAAVSQQEKNIHDMDTNGNEKPNVIKLERSKFQLNNQLKEIKEQIFKREELLETAQARLHRSPHP